MLVVFTDLVLAMSMSSLAAAIGINCDGSALCVGMRPTYAQNLVDQIATIDDHHW